MHEDIRPLLLFFVHERSGPARRMESVVAHLAHVERDRLRVHRIDVDARPDLAERFWVDEVPTLALVKDRRVVARRDGRVSQPQIVGHARAAPRPARNVRRRPRRRSEPASRRLITSSPNAAARAPSTTRWSNVSATWPTGATVTAPSRTTGRSATRPTLRMATSGWFTIGVWKRPASLPALVTVKVEPRSSSAASEPARAPSARRFDLRRELVERTLVAAAHDRDEEAALGLHREAEVVALEQDDLVALEPRVELRELAQRERAGAEQRGHEPVERDAREVALLHPGDRRHLAVGARHVLGDQPAARRAGARAAPRPEGHLRPSGCLQHCVAKPVRPRRRERRPRSRGRAARSPPRSRGRRRARPRAGARAGWRGCASTEPLLATVCCKAGRAALRRPAAEPARRAAAPPRPAGEAPSAITTSAVPTGTTSPSPTRIRSTVPAAGEGISTVVLSVWISTSGSSSATAWPSETSQRAISPSVRPSPRSGRRNS